MVSLDGVVVFTVHDVAEVFSNSNILSLDVLLRYFVRTLILLRFNHAFTLAPKSMLLSLDPFSYIFILDHLQFMLKMRSIYFFISFLNDIIGHLPKLRFGIGDQGVTLVHAAVFILSCSIHLGQN